MEGLSFWINLIFGLAFIGLAGCGMCNALGMMMLANNSKELKDFKRRMNHANLSFGMFTAVMGWGFYVLFS